MAHAICGNYELAEYAVQSAILDIFRRGTPRSRAGLRENLRARVRAMAVEQARLIDDAELTWDGFVRTPSRARRETSFCRPPRWSRWRTAAC